MNTVTNSTRSQGLTESLDVGTKMDIDGLIRSNKYIHKFQTQKSQKEWEQEISSSSGKVWEPGNTSHGSVINEQTVVVRSSMRQVMIWTPAAQKVLWASYFYLIGIETYKVTSLDRTSQSARWKIRQADQISVPGTSLFLTAKKTQIYLYMW